MPSEREPRLEKPSPASPSPGRPLDWDRDRHLQALGERIFDLVVVGGGATGCSVARDAALRGLRRLPPGAGRRGLRRLLPNHPVHPRRPALSEDLRVRFRPGGAPGALHPDGGGPPPGPADAIPLPGLPPARHSPVDPPPGSRPLRSPGRTQAPSRIAPAGGGRNPRPGARPPRGGTVRRRSLHRCRDRRRAPRRGDGGVGGGGGRDRGASRGGGAQSSLPRPDRRCWSSGTASAARPWGSGAPSS